jgi:Na+/H+-dicarboxylate symporter
VKALLAAILAAGLSVAAVDAYLPAIGASHEAAATASLRGVERSARLYAMERNSMWTATGASQAIAETIIPSGTTITLDGTTLVRTTDDDRYCLYLSDILTEGTIESC